MMFSSSVSMAMMEFKTSHLRLNFYNFGDCAVYLIQTKLESQWAEHASLTCWTNQKQELPMPSMFVNRSGRNEQS